MLSKMVSSANVLVYGSRKAYYEGLSDILDKPLLTMRLEFDRDYQWNEYELPDGTASSMSLRDEWACACGHK